MPDNAANWDKLKNSDFPDIENIEIVTPNTATGWSEKTPPINEDLSINPRFPINDTSTISYSTNEGKIFSYSEDGVKVTPSQVIFVFVQTGFQNNLDDYSKLLLDRNEDTTTIDKIEDLTGSYNGKEN